MRRANRVHWFTTEQFNATAEPITHAKQMGTLSTACGEHAFTWSKFWHLPFDQARHPRCEACVDIVAADLVNSYALQELNVDDGIRRVGPAR